MQARNIKSMSLMLGGISAFERCGHTGFQIGRLQVCNSENFSVSSWYGPKVSEFAGFKLSRVWVLRMNGCAVLWTDLLGFRDLSKVCCEHFLTSLTLRPERHRRPFNAVVWRFSFHQTSGSRRKGRFLSPYFSGDFATIYVGRGNSLIKTP